MKAFTTTLALLFATLATLGGFWVGQTTADTKGVQKSAYDAGFTSGVCHPLVYEDGSYVLEDGEGRLCVKP